VHAEGICQEIQRWIEAGREDATIVEGKRGFVMTDIISVESTVVFARTRGRL